MTNELTRGLLIATPYGPGVILKAVYQDPYYKLLVSVSGTDYRLKCIGIQPIGSVELDE